MYLTGFPVRRATRKAIHSSGVICSFPPKPPPTSGAIDPDLGLGDARGGREREPDDVRHLRGAPQRDLLPGRVAHHRARLHERRDEPLLAELALDDDAVVAGLGDRVVHGAATALLGRVELPEGRLVGAEIWVGQRPGARVGLGCLLEVERCRELFVVDLDELGCVAGLSRRPRDHHGHHLAGESSAVHRHRRVVGCLLVGGDRPCRDEAALLLGHVGAGEHRDDVRGLLGLGCVDRGDPGVGERAAHHRQVQHAGELDVVGPAGASGDQPLVLLADAGLADLRRGRARLVGDGHAAPPSVVPAAVFTALTMLW